TTAPEVTVDGPLSENFMCPLAAGSDGSPTDRVVEQFGPTAHWVEYLFPMDWEGVSDWSALRLVFNKTGTGYDLVGVLYDQWTP
ncbi:MAG: hypothetical protein FWD11_08895, partial [Micrococcales bacterium]|nr:hypothetical protein [Micrococcales bacterium]